MQQPPPGWNQNQNQPPPPGWGPPPYGYPPQPPPQQIIIKQTSGCGTALWFAVIVFVIVPIIGTAGCLVCANLT